MEQVKPKKSVKLKTQQAQDYRCRICLKHSEYAICLQNTITVEDQTISYWDLLILVCNLEMETTVSSPKNICWVCAENAEVSYKFVLLCKKSDKILQNELRSNQKCGDFNTVAVEDYDSHLESISKGDSFEFINDLNGYSDSDLEPVDNCTNEQDFNIISSSANAKKIITGTKNNRYIVEQCPSDVNVRDNFVDKNENSKEGSRKVCKFCKYNYILEDSYQEHLIEFHAEHKIGCAFCKQIHFNPQLLVNHMKQDHPHERDFPDNPLAPDFLVNALAYMGKEVDETTCEFCIYFGNMLGITNGRRKTPCNHMKKGVQCTNCKKKFFKKQDMLNHLEIYDSSYKVENNDNETQNGCWEKLLECDFCVYSDELGIIAGTKTKPCEHATKGAQCANCNRIFYKKEDMLRHLDTQHVDSGNKSSIENGPIYSQSTKKKRFKCTLCSVEFIHKTKFHKHVRSQHKTSKKTIFNWHVCNLCGKSFARSEILKLHTELHESSAILT